MSEQGTAGHVSRVGMVVEDKYEVVRLLGAGGMGEVYEARHLQIARRVALKFLLPAVAADASLLERFRNEARAAGALRHENVAAVYDIGVAADRAPYIVMEFLEGRDCAEVLDAVKTFSPSRAASTIIQVCRGLSAAHSHGIIHRDLKPANLFLCRRADGAELVKILDFGIAKLRREAPVDHSTGEIFGTPFYMSPERARGDRAVDHRADIYASGVILYELLSGQRPYDGTSALQILHSILTREPEPLATLRRDIPASLCAVVHRAMAKLPEQRFASVEELERALHPFAPARESSLGSATRLGVTQPERNSDVAVSGTLPTAAFEAPRRGSFRSLVRARKHVAWAVAALAAFGITAWLLRSSDRGLDRTRAPAAASSARALPDAPPADRASGRSIDRPDVSERTGASPESRHIEPDLPRGAEPPRPPVPVSDRAATKRAARIVAAESHESGAAPAAPKPGALRIDHANPYQ